jgi:hypothetical protein
LRANVWQISHGSLAGTSPVSAFTRLAFTSVQSPESVTRIKPLAHESALHQARCNTPRLPWGLSVFREVIHSPKFRFSITSNSDGIL